MSSQTLSADTITFLGTGGARFMVSRQLAASGGLWLDLHGTRFLLDPGPGSIVQAARLKKDPETLDAIILSHRHLDHSTDANVMIEAMTRGGHRRRGRVYAPADCLGEEPVVFSYLRKWVDEVVVLHEGGEYRLGDIAFSTPVRHVHSAETYGLTFRTPRAAFSYIADTSYFDGLGVYAGQDLLIVNMVFVRPVPGVAHLAVTDVVPLLAELKPRAALLNHYGMPVWEAGPERLAAEISRASGVRVVPARDGMVFDLATLDEAAPGEVPADG
jgi:ribonuclease BN (tRNA processing enzyme)